ncbi:ribosome assembly protein RRB1 [Magnaporthiopsis poae ATCC 64411]|uniref:Ribosome assembly protein RRB1 n=1 Tax=Magnaporthiopsis poae (strain ATCC 64411 / 73-15) TaxID=644358 RepID=A0A0C4EFZ8_MAGP6|nr:ribosome assembly protein RRB1 [Magnaporthiopsis poae ATCC 64411]
MDVDEQPRPDMGEFEDEFEDEFESEDEILEAGVDGRPDAEREAEEKSAMDVDGGTGPGTFIVGRTKLEPGQILSPDPTTYDMLHSLTTPWPCLSFDIVRDSLGDNRKVYPATMYAVAGTQAESTRTNENQIMVMKFSGLSKMDKGDAGDSDSDDDDDDEDADPILESKSIPLTSTTNRIRVHQSPASEASRPPTALTATMTESAKVFIHDITPHLASFDTPGSVVTTQQNKPLSTIRAHKSEGYAVDWQPSNLHPLGRLMTGDNDGLMYMTTRTDGGGFVTDTRPFAGHAGSVEDIQWSPSEASVFASASSDGTVRVWDIRSKSRAAALSIKISETDWKPAAAGGGGKAAASTSSTPIASFSYHKEQITSIEWHPTDDSIMAVAAGDNTVTLWDLAVELDDEESRDTAGVQDVPPQLLFVHYHENAKELHWHPQIPGTLVATGNEFSVFKTISV